MLYGVVIMLAITSLVLGISCAIETWTIKVYVSRMTYCIRLLKFIQVVRTTSYYTHRDCLVIHAGHRGHVYYQYVSLCQSTQPGRLTIGSYFDHHLLSLARWLPEDGYNSQPPYLRCHPDGSLRRDLLLGRFDLFHLSPEHKYPRHVRHSHWSHLYKCEYRGKRERFNLTVVFYFWKTLLDTLLARKTIRDEMFDGRVVDCLVASQSKALSNQHRT